MEIRNNFTPRISPNFGMAVKVFPQDVKAFVKYLDNVASNENKSVETLKKGFKKVVKLQKNNKHFDIVYNPMRSVGNHFEIVAKSGEAKVHPGLFSNNVTFGPVRNSRLQNILNFLFGDRKFCRKLCRKMNGPTHNAPKELQLADFQATDAERNLDQILKTAEYIKKITK